MVTVDNKLPLSLYLQLKDLLQGLQAELDHSTAVLDEVYGTRSDLGLHRLSLAIRRVNSNLHDAEFRDALPYVPESTGFSADPNLLSLLVEPLYGKQPGVGVRELIQNAADAVCELEVWCRNHSKDPAALDLPEQDGDVLVDFIRREDGSWFLRVSDRGIGMRSDTIQHYFLRAGASFRQSAEWAQEFLDARGQPRVQRAGRFGIGVFTVFLLGPSFRLRTRHASADRDGGYSVEASADSQLIEIRREKNLKVGTTIEVEISAESVDRLGLEEVESALGGIDWWERKTTEEQVDWFCWDWPRQAQLGAPCIAVADSSGNLPLTTQRYRLSRESLPFVDSLMRDVTLSFIAHSLTSGPQSLEEALTQDRGHPLKSGAFVAHESLTEGIASIFKEGHLRWCATSIGMVPIDPWLHSLLGTQPCLVYGYIRHMPLREKVLPCVRADRLQAAISASFSILQWCVNLDHNTIIDRNPRLSELTFCNIANVAFPSLGAATSWDVITAVRWEKKPGNPWTPIAGRDSKCDWFKTSHGDAKCTLHLEPILEAIEAIPNLSPGLAFVAEIRTAPAAAPESLIARIWKECLGARPIPFDPVAREQLIADACQHAELRQHIERWQAMKRSGSKWVTGG